MSDIKMQFDWYQRRVRRSAAPEPAPQSLPPRNAGCALMLVALLLSTVFCYFIT